MLHGSSSVEIKATARKNFIYHQQDRGSSVKQLKKPTTKCTDSQTKNTSQNPERRRPPDATASPQQLHCQRRESTAPAQRIRPTGRHKRH